MLQIKKLRIRNLLTYEDSGWIELGRRTLIVGPNGSGKTNMIRALRLLRAAVDLEEIRPAEVLNYLHNQSKPLAGIDLEVVLSDEEVEAAYDLLRYYVDGGVGIGNVEYIAHLYDFGEHAGELKELLRNARISMSWDRKQHVDPSKHAMGGYHELAFPDLHLRLLLGEGVEFHSSRSDHGFAYYDPNSWKKLPAKRWVPPGANAACDKKELLERLLTILKDPSGEEREKSLKHKKSLKQLKEAFKKAMDSCAGKGVISSHIVSHQRISYSNEMESLVSKIFEMANISGPATYDEYGTGYLLLRIILGGLLFAGSERPLSGLGKLSALRGSFRGSDLVMDENSINEILDDVGASSASLDAYLRNVEPFLAHLSLSSDHEKKQRFRKISECFSKYFHDVEIDVALESHEVQLRSRPAPPQPGAQSPIDKALSELSAGPPSVIIKLQYPRIYLREKVGGREVPIDMAGQGHRELLSLLTALIGRPGSVVFLDEPASNMHPTLLYQFLMDLLEHGECSEELGRDQVIVVTHSPAVAKLFMEADVGASKKNPAGEGLPDLSIIRVHRDGRDGASVIGHLTPNKWPGGKEEFLKTIGRIVDPRVLFARGVVLVEGPADHAFLREVLRLSETPLENSEKWNKLLRNDVELVWMNSKNNIVTYDKVLNNLKIPYVAVLDFDALCEVLLCRKENERKDHPLYKACECEEALIITPGRLNELNDSGKLSRYRYVLLLDGDGVPDQLDCNDDRVLNIVLKFCDGCIDKDNKCKKESEKCELEGFLKGLGMDLSGCTEGGKLKPESVPECVETQNDEVKGKIKQMGDILFKLINANILGGSTNATASY